ncbi:uncharacterized protein LOC118488372 [Helianthus annuus]|uniref:uncharacterized protein LOC118488372 n=1 Tax=Helianthus annuus TaxID=4232 RepID=UPI0016533402|nr:uncharacterized protein LOC118488372 [Helianthus annuus]
MRRKPSLRLIGKLKSGVARACKRNFIMWKSNWPRRRPSSSASAPRTNERAYAARQKIVGLEAKIAELTSKVEEAQVETAAKQQMEVELSEAKVQLSTKDKDLQAKDVEIAELKRRLDEQIDRCESLEIDLEAEKVKAIDAEEARAVSTAALNVAQTNYSEAQGIVDTLVSEAEWMRTRE